MKLIEEKNKSNEVDSRGRMLTKEQAEFFKDSKVRDEQGRLQVVYHGTKAEFTVFDINSEKKGINFYGNGFYFASHRRAAKSYGNVISFHLNIKKPYELSGQTVLSKKDTDEIINKGYDGVKVFVDPEQTFYVAFSPNQIKSVTNLNPTNSNDIRENKGDSIKLILTENIRKKLIYRCDGKEKGKQITIDIELGHERGINWETLEEGNYDVLYIRGSDDGRVRGGAQRIERIEALIPRVVGQGRKELEKIVDIWKEYHLNGFVSGTKRQIDALNKAGIDLAGTDKEQAQYLNEKDLYVDRGFRYGSGWLIRPLPNEVVDFIKNLY